MSYSAVGIVTKPLALIPAFDPRLGQELLSSPKADIGPGAHTSSKWTQTRKWGRGGGVMSYRYIAVRKNSGYSSSAWCHYLVAVTYMIVHPSTYTHYVRTGVPLPGIKEATQLYLMHALMTCIGTCYTCYFRYCHYILVYCITNARYARFFRTFFYTSSYTN
jgi:hypothetical protein